VGGASHPVASGAVGMNLHLSEMVSQILEPIASSWVGGLETISCEDMLSQFDKLNIKNADWKPEGRPGQLTSELLEGGGHGGRACPGAYHDSQHSDGGPPPLCEEPNSDDYNNYRDEDNILEGGVTSGLMEGGSLEEAGHERECPYFWTMD
jgi:hypothetical protein